MPMSVRVMRNVDFVVFPLALVLFLAAGWPIAGWATGLAAWAVQRGIHELAVHRAEKAEDVRTRVGLLAGSMILRGWVVAGIIVAVGLGNSDAGLSAAVLFLAVFTLQLTMTMAMRPFEPPPPKPAKQAKPSASARASATGKAPQ
jgi:predicted lipid-binding transport protein (Tim44 family)